MAVLQKVAFYPNERFDTPDARAIEAFSLNDWRYFLTGFLSDRSYILAGFEVSNYDTIFTIAGFKVKVSNAVLFHPESTVQAAGFYVFAGSESDISVNLSPNSTNYVELEMNVDSGTPDVRAFWDSGANSGQGAEFTDTVDTVINLELKITSNISGFTAGKIPLYKATTNPSGAVTSLTDVRPLFFRLGTGGQTPNPDYDFVWPTTPDSLHARAETPITSTLATLTNQPFYGGDKNLKSFKHWMDAVMTSIKEIKGTPFWYNQGVSSGLLQLFFNSNLTLTSTGAITWNAVTNGGTLSWASSFVIKDAFRSQFEINAENTFTLFASAFADNEFLYVKIRKPETLLVDGDTDGINTCRVTDASGFTVGQDVYVGSSTQAGVRATISNISVSSPYVITTNQPLGTYLKIDGAYVVPIKLPILKELGNTGDLRPDALGNIDSNIFLFCLRTGNKIYFRNGTLELDTGETAWLGDGIPQGHLTFTGATDENDDAPSYTSQGGPWIVTDGDPLNIGITKLDKAIEDILTDTATEDVFEIAVNQTVFNLTNCFCSTNNNIPDITVRVNGFTKNVGATRDYTKTGTQQVTFNYAVQGPAVVVVRQERTGGTGGGGGGGITWSDPVDAVITPDNTNTRDFGTNLKKFRDGYFSRNFYIGGKLTVTGGIDPTYLELDPVDPTSVVIPNNAFFVDANDSNKLKYKNDGGSTGEIGVSTPPVYLSDTFLNSTGSTIANFSAIYIKSDGSIETCDADIADRGECFGLVTGGSILTGNSGLVAHTGKISGALVGKGWSAGTRVYVSETPGQLTNVPPGDPGDTVFMIGIAGGSGGADLYLEKRFIILIP